MQRRLLISTQKKIPLVQGRKFNSSSILRDSLVVVDHDNVKLGISTLHTVSAASKMGKQVDLLVVGKNCQPVVDACSKIDGVRKVWVAEEDEHPTAERITEIVVAKQKDGKYTHILGSSSTFGKNVIPRIGAKLDVQPISEIQAVVSEDTFIRPIYAGNALQTVQSSDSVKVLTVRTTAFAAASQGSGSASVDKLDTGSISKTNVTSFLSQNLQQSERPDLQSADRVISGGRALKSGDNFKILYELADTIKAAVGASRAAVDAGYVPNDMQVGQTGKVVAPQLYIAVGISGAIQHLAGMKDSKVIVAINEDADAPIFQVADYGLVSDLFKAVPEMNTKLKK